MMINIQVHPPKPLLLLHIIKFLLLSYSLISYDDFKNMLQLFLGIEIDRVDLKIFSLNRHGHVLASSFNLNTHLVLIALAGPISDSLISEIALAISGPA